MNENLRRIGNITVEKQKTKGRTANKTKKLILRIIGIILLFLIPIGTVIGVIIIIMTFCDKKSKFLKKYKITGECPVCKAELYLSTDEMHGIVEETCDECKTELKINIDKGTINEKFKGKIKLHQDKKMNYMANKDVDLDELRVKADDQQDLIDSKERELRHEEEDRRHKMKLEKIEAKNKK